MFVVFPTGSVIFLSRKIKNLKKMPTQSLPEKIGLASPDLDSFLSPLYTLHFFGNHDCTDLRLLLHLDRWTRREVVDGVDFRFRHVLVISRHLGLSDIIQLLPLVPYIRDLAAWIRRR